MQDADMTVIDGRMTCFCADVVQTQAGLSAFAASFAVMYVDPVC